MMIALKGIGPTTLIVLGLMALPRVALPQDQGTALGGGTALNSGSGNIRRLQVEEPVDETAVATPSGLSAEDLAQIDTARAKLQRMIEADPALRAMQEAMESTDGAGGPAAMEKALMQALDGGRPPAQLPEDAGILDTLRVIGEERDAAMRRAAAFGRMMGEMQDAEGAEARAAREAAALAKANRPPTVSESLFDAYGRSPRDRAPFDVVRDAIGLQIEATIPSAPASAVETGVRMVATDTPAPAPATTLAEATPPASANWPRPSAAELDSMKSRARQIYRTGQPLDL